MTATLEKFSKCCTVTLMKGPAGELVVKGMVKFRDGGKIVRLEKKVDITQLVKLVVKSIAGYHRKLHGDVSVSGWKSSIRKGLKAAKKIGKSSVVKSLYKKASPFLAAAVPGGTAALALVTSAHNVLVAAKAGDKRALEKIRQIKTLAENGNTKALLVIDKMSAMNETLNDRNPQTACVGHDIVGWNPLKAVKKVARKVGRAAKKVARVVPVRSLARVAKYTVPGAAAAMAVVNAARGRSKPRPAQQAMLPAPEYSCEPTYCEEYQAEPTYCEEYQAEPGYCEGYYCGQVGGWVYNKPYRSVLEASLNPGLRSLYNRGLDRGALV